MRVWLDESAHWVCLEMALGEVLRGRSPEQLEWGIVWPYLVFDYQRPRGRVYVIQPVIGRARQMLTLDLGCLVTDVADALGLVVDVHDYCGFTMAINRVRWVLQEGISLGKAAQGLRTLTEFAFYLQQETA